MKANESTIAAVKIEYHKELNINVDVDVVKQLYCIENFLNTTIKDIMN